MDVSAVVSLAVAAVLVLLVVPRPKFVRARAQYDLPRPQAVSPDRPLLSLLMPLRSETWFDGPVETLLLSTPWNIEILLVLYEDDSVTRPLAEELVRRHPDRVRTVELPITYEHPSTRAAALNGGLPHCAGEFTGVIDADSVIPGHLLAWVEGAFRASGVDVVRTARHLPRTARSTDAQARLDGMLCVWGREAIRVSRQFFLGQSEHYFVRTDLLRVLGGWDDDCKAEELELMLRLFSYGAKGALLHVPQHLWPERIRFEDDWRSVRLRRARRYMAMLQIHRTGEWRRFPSRRDRLAARRAFLAPVLRALVAVPGIVGVLTWAVAAWGDRLHTAVLIGWTTAALTLPAAAGTHWLLTSSRPRWWQFLLPVHPYEVPLLLRVTATRLVDLAVDARAAAGALGSYLATDRKVLRAHFERSRVEPPRPPGAAPPDPPEAPAARADLLDVAGSPDTPAATAAMAEGLDALFRALGPPPSSLRLAETGPPPHGGASDG